MIDNAEKLEDLRVPPANRLEALKVDRQGHFLNMQNDIDIRNAKLENREDLETIQALQYA